jgi:ABC-type multidrug transport system ATPase subunit
MSVVRDGVDTGETDWLESGIEIIARPPGKQPRSISQLSGGEKSMTAVALLMAIFRSKPSCFCVLDEVDAALDDANVDRFCRVVEEFTTMSSFIVITHHKRTMHQADQLFGVTMQERGVSKRVSVRIDQIGADGSIKELPAGELVAATTKAAAATAAGKPGIAGKANRGSKSGHGEHHNQTPSDKDPNNLAPIGTGKLREDKPAEPTGQQMKAALGAMVQGEKLEVASQ